MVGSKRNLKMHVRNLGYPFPYKPGAQKLPFRRFRNFKATLTDYIYGTKYDIHKRASALQTTRGLLHRLKTTWTLILWSTNGFKLDRSFYPPSVFCPSHTHYKALTWRPTATLDETALGSTAAQIWNPKDVNLEMLSCQAALSGNTSS